MPEKLPSWAWFILLYLGGVTTVAILAQSLRWLFGWL